MAEPTDNEIHRIEAILDFWFGQIEGVDDTDSSKMQLWWKGHPDDDAEIRRQFTGDVQAALDGELDHWAGAARGTLALVLLLDQFTRVLGRGTPQAFAGDGAAQRHCLAALDAGADASLRFCERSFLYMPLMHAEDKELARRSLAVFEGLEADRAEHRGTPPEASSHAQQHAEIVLRFGRYPHRNAIVGRESTPEEEAFLASGGPSFGQKKK